MTLSKAQIASILVGGAIVIGGIVVALLPKSNSGQTTVSSDVPVGTASLTLSPATKSVKVGEQFTLDVMLDTAGDLSSGVDLSMNYDPKLLDVVDSDAAADGIQIAPATVFDFSPQNLVTLATGHIDFSASQQATSKGVAVTGQKIATITFKTKSAGSATVSFDFTPGSLDDTNVIKIEDARDLLNTIEESTVTITQ